MSRSLWYLIFLLCCFSIYRAYISVFISDQINKSIDIPNKKKKEKKRKTETKHYFSMTVHISVNSVNHLSIEWTEALNADVFAFLITHLITDYFVLHVFAWYAFIKCTLCFALKHNYASFLWIASLTIQLRSSVSLRWDSWNPPL